MAHCFDLCQRAQIENVAGKSFWCATSMQVGIIALNLIGEPMPPATADDRPAGQRNMAAPRITPEAAAAVLAAEGVAELRLDTLDAVTAAKATFSTLKPQPSTLNPQPSTLNPQPSTLNPQPSTSTLNPQPACWRQVWWRSCGWTHWTPSLDAVTAAQASRHSEPYPLQTAVHAPFVCLSLHMSLLSTGP